MRALASITRPARLACTAAVLAVLGLPAFARAQQVAIYYVAPHDTVKSIFGETVSDNLFENGYSLHEITAANVAKFRLRGMPNLVKTYDVLKPGTTVRKRLNEIMQINGGITDVLYLLVDDRSGITDTMLFASMPRIDGKFYVWPAAHVDTSKANPRRFLAWIGLGTCAADTIQFGEAGGWKAWEGTICHETTHTQFVTDASRWASINTVYGGDQNHSFSELLGDQELTFEEGLGNFFGLIDNADWARDVLVNFFTRTNQRYVIESRSFLAGNKDMWDAPHLESATSDTSKFPQELQGAERRGTYALRYYKWTDVPGFYVLWNEHSSTAFHYLFWKFTNGNPDAALAMVRRSVKPMTRNVHKKFLAFSVNRLSLELEDLASQPAGRALRKDGKLTSSLYPYALLDLITHFGMTDAQYQHELTSVYPGKQPKAFKEYWARRDAIRQLVSAKLAADPIQIEEAAKAIHDYCRQDAAILASIP